MTPEQKKLGEIIRKAIADPSFKARLKADPKATLAQAGLELPEKVTVNVVEETANNLWIRLPYRVEGELSVDELEAIVGGFHEANFSGQWTG